MKKIIVVLSAVLSCLQMSAQDRLTPGKIYEQGEEIFAPMIGLKAKVPTGWFGTLPQGEEVFLMIPNNNESGYMFINAHPLPFEKVIERWQHDFSLTETITISIKGEPKIQNNKATAEFDVVGSQEPYTGYAEAMDGGHGFTIVFILLSPANRLEQFMKDFTELTTSANVEAPSIGSRYAEFNWAEFLQQTYLMSYISAAHFKEQNHIWLCPDGSFRSKVKSGGFVKGEKSPYKGKNKGTWSAEGIGSKGTLYLNFSKKPQLVVNLEIRDDKVYLNGERFYGLENSECK